MRHCRTCTCPPVKRKAIAKVSRKVSTRAVNGIITYPDGREKCATKKAWAKRREEVFQRDDGRCQQSQNFIGVFGGVICAKALTSSEAHIHHIRKRSVGRDDRLKNLITLCGIHHALYDSKPQWSNVGEPIKGKGWSAQWQERGKK